MRILGIDPGTLQLGWGVIEKQGTRLRHVAHGVVRAKGEVLADRLVQIDVALEKIVAMHAPDVGAVETIFFSKNAQSAAKLGHARGVVLVRLRRGGMNVHEYAPARVKRAVAGNGRASKDQVAGVVRALLALDATPPSDAADALAVALTHHHVARFEAALAGTRR